jgi:hypothetical protein
MESYNFLKYLFRFTLQIVELHKVGTLYICSEYNGWMSEVGYAM